MVKLDSNLCTFCENVWETIYHLLWDCPKVQQLFGTQRQFNIRIYYDSMFGDNEGTM